MRCFKSLIVTACFMVFALSFAGCSGPAEDQPTQFRESQVIRVIDGDTIEVNIYGSAYKIRYIGIDTPELGEPCFSEATAANRELVEGMIVRLEKDVSETDRHGRLLRYVYVGDMMVNAELVRQGYAQVYTYPPDVKYNQMFLELQREAQEVEKGCWSTGS
ncbi:MAG: thermonuclease family protein [Dehalococcoidales bacterium]|nr:thermonuclease family protein [Dehalococcoidales bacterium]